MFEDILKDLNVQLDDLRAKRMKCEDLMQRVQDKEKKTKLSIQYDVICQAIDRAALCLDILGYGVSLEVSEDWRVVKFI